MCKKILLTAGLLVAGSMLVFGTRVGAYGRAMVGWAKNSIVNRVPVEADLMAAKQMLSDIDGKVENAVRVVAAERVAVRRLDAQFAVRETELSAKRDQLLVMREGLKAQPAANKPGEYDLQRARLSQQLSSYEILENLQKTEGKTLENRRKGLVSAETKVANLKTAQIDLRGRIESLEARRKLMEAEKIVANVEVDDSEIAGLKNLVSEIEKKLDVEVEVNRELDSLKTGKPTAQTESNSAADLLERIDQKFGKAKKAAGASL